MSQQGTYPSCNVLENYIWPDKGTSCLYSFPFELKSQIVLSTLGLKKKKSHSKLTERMGMGTRDKLHSSLIIIESTDESNPI